MIADVKVDGVSVGTVPATRSRTSRRATRSTPRSRSDPRSRLRPDGWPITPSGAVADCGSDQPFAVAANPCYSIANVVVDGGSVGAVAGYTFTNVQGAHTIAATFAVNTFTVDASAGAGGSIAPSGAVSANCGADAAFSVAANPCYSIADVVARRGSVVRWSAAYTFTNVRDEPHHRGDVRARFVHHRGVRRSGRIQISPAGTDFGLARRTRRRL
jgi:hypothetical protein